MSVVDYFEEAVAAFIALLIVFLTLVVLTSIAVIPFLLTIKWLGWI